MLCVSYMSRTVKKRTFGMVRPKIQISLRIRVIRSEFSLCAFWIAKDASFLHAGNEDSDQTAQKRRLICVFVGRTCQKIRFLTWRIICFVYVLKQLQSNFDSSNTGGSFTMAYSNSFLSPYEILPIFQEKYLKKFSHFIIK